MKGWFKFHRKMFENPVCNKDSEYFYVWCWLLTYAKYEEERALFYGKDIILQKGQLITTTKEISNELKMNESKVRRILNFFEINKQIDKQTSPKNTLITVLNWDYYQGSDEQNDEQVTNERQTNGKPSYYNKELKKERKEEHKDVYSTDRKQIIDYLNQKCGTAYNFDDDANINIVNSKLSKGYKVEDFIKIIDKKYDQWHGTEREQYLRPETLFGMKFDGYLNQKINKKSAKPQQQSGFNNFPQRQYDFEQLERELTGQGLEGG